MCLVFSKLDKNTAGAVNMIPTMHLVTVYSGIAPAIGNADGGI